MIGSAWLDSLWRGAPSAIIFFARHRGALDMSKVARTATYTACLGGGNAAGRSSFGALARKLLIGLIAFRIEMNL